MGQDMDALSYFKAHELFQDVPENTLSQLAHSAEKLTFGKGEVLARQNDAHMRFFLIVSGRVGLLRDRARHLGELGDGDFFGETVLLTQEKCPYDIIALRRTEVYTLSEQSFFDLVQTSPEILRKLISSAAHQMNHLLRKIPFKHPIRRLGFILLQGSYEEKTFVSAFSKLLSKPLLIDKQPSSHFVSFQKEENAWILLQANPKDIAWIKEVMEESDRTFLVGKADALLDALPIDGLDPTLEWIALHEKNSPPSKIAFPKRAKIHHIRENYPGDMERLLRSITGKSITLVLGSGGARTAAQLGVLEALSEGNIPIDAIGGVGLGSLIAALYAMGVPPSKIHRIMRNLYTNLKHHLDFTFPMLSLVKGKRIQTILKSLFQDTRIEDLWLPFFAISSDLGMAQEYVHREGELWKAVRASFSIPGILPPVCLENRCLIDGGLTNILPLDVMREMIPEGKVIALDTDTPREWGQPKRFPHFISGWKSLILSLIPFAQPRVPNILQTLLRSTLLDSSLKKRELLEENPPDLLIQPPLKRFSSLDFAAFEAMYKIAYKNAKEHISEWKKKLE